MLNLILLLLEISSYPLVFLIFKDLIIFFNFIRSGIFSVDFVKRSTKCIY
jgi:hypothetical protein